MKRVPVYVERSAANSPKQQGMLAELACVELVKSAVHRCFSSWRLCSRLYRPTFCPGLKVHTLKLFQNVPAIGQQNTKIEFLKACVDFSICHAMVNSMYYGLSLPLFLSELCYLKSGEKKNFFLKTGWVDGGS